MPARNPARRYRATEAKYKGGADELYVTYDLEQPTRGEGSAVYPKVRRVYIAGDVKDWQVGDFTKKSGRLVHGVKIDFRQTREGYQRKAFTAMRGTTTYEVPAVKVKPAIQTFSQIVEVPEAARNVRFHTGRLPERYRAALQDVR